ncbi:MAG: cupin domain-containing protein [Luminiphilus sp.]
MVLSGTNQHWQKVLHEGEFVVALYEAMPAVIDIAEPYPYDEYVRVLEGSVVLTSSGGERQSYEAGDAFLVPVGWTGTWEMPTRFRELIIVDRNGWEAVESMIATLFGADSESRRGQTSVLPLLTSSLKRAPLEDLPPWPQEVVLSGASKHGQKVLHSGNVVAALYGAEAARLSVGEPFPYDEYVLVLSGEVTLTSNSGESQTFGTGDSFLVPKGWTGTWDMPGRYLEKIVVETAAWNAAEG